MIVWHDGKLEEDAAVRIDPSDRGFTLGDGIFETMAMRAGKVLRLDAHLARLRTGCEVLALPLPEADLPAAIDAVCTANRLPDAAIRLTLSRGPAPRSLLPPARARPTLLITPFPWPGAPTPARCIVATVTRRNEFSPLARIKAISYLDNILARQEAAARGANEAILLNTAGRVAEATVSNLFAVKDGRIFTPPVAEGALPGTMRGLVLEAYEGVEVPIEAEDLFKADGLFLTNSLGIRTVATVDGKSAGNGARAFIEDLRTKLAA